MLSPEDYWKIRDSVTERIWRLEALQVYTIPSEQEEFDRFRRGEPLPEPYEYDWRDDVQEYVKRGVYVGRVHLVRRPISDYLRYQFEWGYEHSVPAGDDVRIIDLSNTPNPGVPEEDFWVFDEHVVRLLFTADGRLRGRELVEGGEADRYKDYMRVAIENSVPFADFDA